MEKDETSFKSPFAAAVNAIIDSHKKLYDILLTSFGIYNSGVIPPRHNRISRILDCEANGAHTILEGLAVATKAEPRGSLGAAPDLLIAECRDFLDFLEDNLKSPDCAASINDIRQTEEAFTNLIKGLSGCDPNITTEEYHKRIDKFIRDLKDLFRNLGSAIVKYEFSLCDHTKAAQETLNNHTTKPIEPKLISPPSRKKDDLRRTAVALMKRVKKDTACTWSEAEDTVQKAMWKEFDNCGLRVSKNNFHSLRYNNNYIDEPEADDALMEEYSLLTFHESHKILTA